MQISRTLFERMISLFANNTALMGIADPNQIRIQPVKQAFTPGLDRVLADVPVQAAPLTFNSISVADALLPHEYTDALTGDRVAAWGTDGLPWNFIGGAGTYPFTIHGTRLVTQDDATLLATELLPTPVPMAASGQGFAVPPIAFRFPSNMVR